MAVTNREVRPLRATAVIVGVGQIEFAKAIDRPEAHLAADSVMAARRDAGIEPTEVHAAPTCLVTSCEGVPTSAIVLRAA